MRQRTGASTIKVAAGQGGQRVALSKSRDHYFPLLGRPSRRSRRGYVRRLGLFWENGKGKMVEIEDQSEERSERER